MTKSVRVDRFSRIGSFWTLALLSVAVNGASSAPVGSATNNNYQLEAPHDTQISSPESTAGADSGALNCRLECEMGSAGECSGCLRQFEAAKSQLDSPVQAPEAEETARNHALSLEEMDKMISPLLWSPALRNYPNRWPRAQQLLRRLRQESANGNRQHKKDLRMALQRSSLNEADINALLRNTWVGR